MDNAASLFLIRLHGLEKINQTLGYRQANSFLRQIGDLVSKIAGDRGGEASGHLAARLNGSDFALIAPHIEDAAEFANRLMGELAALSSRLGCDSTNLYHIGAVYFQTADTLGELLASADSALAVAERRGVQCLACQQSSVRRQACSRYQQLARYFSAGHSPMTASSWSSIPWLAPLARHCTTKPSCACKRRPMEGGWRQAISSPPRSRLNLTGPLDLAVMRHALQMLESSTGDLAINLCIESVSERADRDKLGDLLRQHPELCSRLWVEVPEDGAFRNFDALQDFCRGFQELGCRTGIEHFGHHQGEFGRLTGLGLHYLKIDASFVHGINQNRSNQKFLKGLCNLARGNGIMVIAGGVQNEAELKTLTKLGVKGFTGPGVK